MSKRPRAEPIREPTLFEMVAGETDAERPYAHPNLHLGTSAFTASGWSGNFYPAGTKPAEYLTHYAKTFRSVEIDTTYYATPAASTVVKWYEKTPPDFIFAAKVPQAITHEKQLVDCDAELHEFLDRMKILKEKLGPLLLQFPWFDKYQFQAGTDFLARLRSFLGKLPEDLTCKFVVEIRNKDWLDHRFLDALRAHKVALALTDTSFMPRPWELKEPLDLITADFAYVRWLGNRRQIETMTTTWDKTIVDRTEDLRHWVQFVKQTLLARKLRHVFLFANNHYAGYGPGTVERFWELYNQS